MSKGTCAPVLSPQSCCARSHSCTPRHRRRALPRRTRRVRTPEFVYEANEPKRALKEGKVIRAIRVVTPPAVDGRLGDEVWTLAPVATGFMQRDPDNGQSMTRQTRIQVAYDDRFLYVAVAVLDDNGHSSPPVSGGVMSSRRPTWS